MTTQTDERLERVLMTRSSHAIGMIALGIVLIIGRVDYETGVNVSFSALYLAPIGVMAWFGGARKGIWMAVFCAAIACIAMKQAQRFDETIPYSFAVNLVSFTGMAWLVSRIRTLSLRLRHGLHHKSARLDREQAERRRVELEFECLFNLSPGLLCMLDYDLRIQTTNDPWKKLCEPSLLKGKRFLDLVHPDDLGSASLAFRQARDTGESQRFVARLNGDDRVYRSIAWTVNVSKACRRLFLVAYEVCEPRQSALSPALSGAVKN